LRQSGIILAVCALSLSAQTNSGTVSVPFVGCPGDGMVGPVEAPKGTSVSLRIDPKAAQGLAYYQAGMTNGVLGPRGWHCWGTYGSSGSTLFIMPTPVEGKDLSGKDVEGDAIELTFQNGETSGRFSVAAVIARAFPEYKDFVARVNEEAGDLRQNYETGPYPSDKLTYKSKSMVEYRTPAGTDGLGTYAGLKKNNEPIEGVAVLVGRVPSLVLLSVRLPAKLRGLTPIIIKQIEEHPAASDK
jgi:hypothetical protein